MEQTENKPIRKRRRWPIVAFVLALLSLTTWWYWPRGDARFVGKWKDSTAFFEFRSNGWGTFSPLINGVPRPHPMRWWVREEFLFIENWTGHLKYDVQNLILRLRGKFPASRFRILQADSAVLRLQQDNGLIQTWECDHE